MREESALFDSILAAAGITPAHAGRINCMRTGLSDGEDHPRACGKNKEIKYSKTERKGSPPRMREECLDIARLTLPGRITPAHAGRIDRVSTQSCRQSDHPRACGKNITSKSTEQPPIGSPPRMREECKSSISPLNLLRITPAHAGRITDCCRFFTSC